MKSVNEKFRKLRLQNGYTQQFVANCLEIDRSNYSKYELGKLELGLELVRKLCILYSVSADEILELKDV